MGDLRTPLIILVAAHVVNVVLELLFVYGFDWGLAGLGVGHGDRAGRHGRWRSSRSSAAPGWSGRTSARCAR